MEKEKPVVLTTSHKSKGLEFERVFILRDDSFPSPKATTEDELEQEENAKYVAYTRAKDQLHIVKLEGQPGYSKR
jgi:superfamily I DNA/RNA helicase